MKNKSIGDQIAYWRKRRGMTQGELAVKIGVANNTVISGYEKGIRMPSLMTLQKIAEALNCEVFLKMMEKKA